MSECHFCFGEPWKDRPYLGGLCAGGGGGGGGVAPTPNKAPGGLGSGRMGGRPKVGGAPKVNPPPENVGAIAALARGGLCGGCAEGGAAARPDAPAAREAEEERPFPAMSFSKAIRRAPRS